MQNAPQHAENRTTRGRKLNRTTRRNERRATRQRKAAFLNS